MRSVYFNSLFSFKMSLSGKVGVVTGAAKGLGKGFAESLLSKGAKVCTLF